MILQPFWRDHCFGQFFLEMASECIHDCQRAGAQGISIALALTELFIAKKGRGACGFMAADLPVSSWR